MLSGWALWLWPAWSQPTATQDKNCRFLKQSAVCSNEKKTTLHHLQAAVFLSYPWTELQSEANSKLQHHLLPEMVSGMYYFESWRLSFRTPVSHQILPLCWKLCFFWRSCETWRSERKKIQKAMQKLKVYLLRMLQAISLVGCNPKQATKFAFLWKWVW